MNRSDRVEEWWGRAAQDWAELQEPMGRPLWEAMLTAAEVGPGTRLLDAGCGGGGAAALAVERGAVVVGLDASPALIEVARRKVPHATFVEGDLQALPFEKETFEVSMASLSLMFPEDPLQALRELRRVTVSGGRVVAGVWGMPEQCDMTIPFRALKRLLPEPPPNKGPFQLSDPGLLEALMHRAGLEVIGTGEVNCPFEYTDFNSLWRAQRSAGPTQAAIAQIGEETIREAMREAVSRFYTEEGTLRLNNRMRWVMGRV